MAHSRLLLAHFTTSKWQAVQNLLFSKLCLHKQCSQCSCSCVETLVVLRAKFHVASSLLSVLKITILMLVYQRPHTPLKISLPKNETTVNPESASFLVIMLLHEGLTHIQSQIKPLLLFGESFTSKLRLLHMFQSGNYVKHVIRQLHSSCGNTTNLEWLRLNHNTEYEAFMMRQTEEESTVSGAAARARQTLSESFGATGTIQVQRKNMWSFKWH